MTIQSVHLFTQYEQLCAELLIRVSGPGPHDAIHPFSSDHWTDAHALCVVDMRLIFVQSEAWKRSNEELLPVSKKADGWRTSGHQYISRKTYQYLADDDERIRVGKIIAYKKNPANPDMDLFLNMMDEDIFEECRTNDALKIFSMPKKRKQVGDSAVCKVCKRGDNDAMMLLCDYEPCNSGYHLW